MTMKEKLNKLLTAKQEQRSTLQQSLVDCDDKEQRAAIGETLSALAEEIRNIEEMLADVDQPAEQEAARDETETDDNNNERGMNVMATMDMRTENNNAKETEARAKQLHENGKAVIANADARAVLVSAGKLATPTEVDGINDIMGARVSSIVDMVKVVDASGMGAYKVAYQLTDAEAATQTEGEEYHAGEPTFDFVEIKPQTEAVRKRAAAIITTNLLASKLNVALSAIALDEKFLRKIALSYGGDESVVGAAVLQINKADLITLGDVRGSDKKPVYEITPDAGNPNTGIIKDGGLAVHYVINSNLTGKQIYGQMKNFELALFSDYEINVSEDFAFNKGLLAIRGDVELGGDVTVQGGFVVAAQA